MDVEVFSDAVGQDVPTGGGTGSEGGATAAGMQTGGGGGGSNAGGSGGAGGHGRVKITYDVASPGLPPIFYMSYQLTRFHWN